MERDAARRYVVNHEIGRQTAVPSHDGEVVECGRIRTLRVLRMPVEEDTTHTGNVRYINYIVVVGPVRNQLEFASQIRNPFGVDIIGRCRHAKEQATVIGAVRMCIAHTFIVEGDLNLGGGGIDIDVTPSPRIIVTT